MHEVGVQIVTVCAGDVGVIGIRKCGCEQLTVGATAVMQGAVKGVCRPVADASFEVWRDVAGVNRAKRCGNGLTTRIRRAATCGVTSGAVTEFGEVCTTLQNFTICSIFRCIYACSRRIICLNSY